MCVCVCVGGGWNQRNEYFWGYDLFLGYFLDCGGGGGGIRETNIFGGMIYFLDILGVTARLDCFCSHFSFF